ncbi:proliferating cell nuclear antigen (pcna) [Candidatus Pacearchaeota archaeon]|nr:proliferating cell nuclear antigen (pcna) [Candidatus Pacearchaeota archaeon]MBD3282705.1 proliferating cell nuclear antigen (pcna) [Candidatus Pacearchaeota archaeon]
MLLKIERPKILSDIISIISELVLEVRLKVSNEGVNITAIDPANVAMVTFKLPSSAFSEIKVEKQETLGVSLENLKAVLRRLKTGSILVLSKNENELKIEIIDKIRREFNLSLIEVEGEEKEIPSLEFTARIEMTSQDFAEAIEDCLVVSDSCSFESQPNKFVIKAKGSLNSFNSEFSSDEINIQAEEAHSKYSLEYLQKIIKATKITDKVRINFSNDYPLRLDFNTPIIELGFVLAPRVETED